MELIGLTLLACNLGFTWKILDRLSEFHYRLRDLEDEVFPTREPWTPTF